MAIGRDKSEESTYCEQVTRDFMRETREYACDRSQAVIANWWVVAKWLAEQRAAAREDAFATAHVAGAYDAARSQKERELRDDAIALSSVVSSIDIDAMAALDLQLAAEKNENAMLRARCAELEKGAIK